VSQADGSEQPIVVLVGPTATGKTDVGIRVAEALNGEIISADSQAVYRGMDVGTAKPDADEQARAPFHLIDVAEPDEPFSAARFKELAKSALQNIRSRGRWPILVGGTGLYVKVLLEDYGLTATSADPVIRARLDQEALASGAPALHARLNQVDPDAASRIHPNDRIRIVRALEVFERTGEPISKQHSMDAASRTRMRSVKFGLTAPKAILDERIDRRVDSMIARGLVEEVQELLRRGYSDVHPPLRSLGYKELCAAIRGECELDRAIADIKQNTRRFARRQLTWFRADPEITWIDVSGKSPEDVAEDVLTRLKAP
jgi:tRNA dimethylallyltransferase